MNPLALLLKAARNGLGLIIVFFNWLSLPKPAQRSNEDQAKAQASVNHVSLYQLFACPFCVKTRRAIHALGINVEIRDINEESAFRADLAEKAGKVAVPCLRIENGDDVEWMYESSDIITYLQQQVAQAK